MKHLLISASILFLLISSVFSTEQVPDRLIIGSDTILLKSFPLDDLNLPPPFKYGDFTFPSTACWRGYMATWKIIENRLMLLEVEKMDSTDEKLDIPHYLRSNGYEPEIINGFVFANWYSAKLIIYDYTYHKYSNLYLYEPYLPTNEVPLIVFDSGILITNDIKSMEIFHIGDTITKQVSYRRGVFSNYGKAEVKAVIVDKNQKMVKIEILTYGTDDKHDTDEVKKEILGYWDENYWVNPHYWKSRDETNILSEANDNNVSNDCESSVMEYVTGFIPICNYSCAVDYVLHIKNSFEFHLENGIIYIQQFYKYGNIKSESYWVNRVIPALETRKYDNSNGNLLETIDKRHGDYDLCALMDSVHADEDVLNGNPQIYLIPSDGDKTVDLWSVSYEVAKDCEYRMTLNTENGTVLHHDDFILDHPIEDNITEEMKPTFCGGKIALYEYIGNQINLPEEEITNAEVFVGFSVDTYGKVNDFNIVKSVNDILDSEALRIISNMPKWKAAKDTSEYRKMQFVMPVTFRDFN